MKTFQDFSPYNGLQWEPNGSRSAKVNFNLTTKYLLLAQAENIMLLELDISPPTMVPLDLQRSDIRTQDLIRDFVHYRKKSTASRVMKARSW